MVKWGYTKKSVYVDEDFGTMKICDVCIVETSVKDGVLKIEWCLKGFESWGELQGNAEFLEIIQKCNNSLKASQDTKNKGVGKGSIQGPF